MKRIPTGIISTALGLLLGAAFAAAIEMHLPPMEAPIRAPSPTTQPDITAGIDLARLVIVFELANPGNKTPRGFDQDLLAHGWPAFFAKHIDPEIAWLKARGAKRIRVMLHNPYGLETEGRAFAFTQRAACARDPKTRHLANGLRRQLERITAAGAEPIVYLGSFNGDDTEATPATIDTIDEWIYAAREILDAKAAIGFDWSNDLAAAAPAERFITLCESLTTVYREPRLKAGRRGNVISTDSFWIRTDPAKYADAKWAAANQDHDEVIRWLQYPDGEAGWTDRFPGDVAARLATGARRVQADGDTAAIAPGWMRNQ